MDKYMTCEEVRQVMSGVHKREALQCLGGMNDYISRIEEQINLRYRCQGG